MSNVQRLMSDETVELFHVKQFEKDKCPVRPNHAHAIIIIQNIVGVDPCVDPEQNY